MNKKWLFPIFAGVLLLTIALVYKPKEVKKDYSKYSKF